MYEILLFVLLPTLTFKRSNFQRSVDKQITMAGRRLVKFVFSLKLLLSNRSYVILRFL